MLSRNRSDVENMNESGTTGVLCDLLSPGPRRQTGLLAVSVLIRSVAIFAVLFVIHFAVCKYNSEFSCLCVTYVDNVTLPAFPPPPPAAAATINRYLLPAGPTAANLHQRRVAAGWDRWTDRRTPDSFIDPAARGAYYLRMRTVPTIIIGPTFSALLRLLMCLMIYRDVKTHTTK